MSVMQQVRKLLACKQPPEGPAWNFQCGSFLGVIWFLGRTFSAESKKELHWKVQLKHANAPDFQEGFHIPKLHTP